MSNSSVPGGLPLWPGTVEEAERRKKAEQERKKAAAEAAKKKAAAAAAAKRASETPPASKPISGSMAQQAELAAAEALVEQRRAEAELAR
ncbi:MAG TPA: hypothetical protein VE172_24490, partial [Stackebrandtia sp.]|nr:hypothetical protein [Stackebrandtia sp.]